MELQLIHGPWPLYTNSFLLFTPSEIGRAHV